MLSWKLRPVYVRGFRRQPLSAIRRILKTKGFDIRKIVEIGFLHGTSMLEVWAYEHETNDIVNRLIHHDYRTYFDRRPTEPFLFDSAAFRKLAKPEQEQFANDNFIYRLERITSRVDSCLRRSAKRQFEAMLDWERSRAAPAPDHHHVPMAPAGEQPRPPMSSGPMRPTDAPPAVVPVQAAPSTDESVAPAESPTDDVPVTPEDDRPSIDICDDDAHTNADSCSSCAMDALYPPVASIINELAPPSSDLVEMPADDVRDDNAFQLDSQKSYSMRRRPIAKRQAVSLTLEEEEEDEPSGAADERAGGGPAASADNDAAARSASQTDEQGTMRPVLPAPASAGLAGTTETNPTQRC
ncbi:hypothetical protein PBRA_009705 [Plasmodiophora brassicae]|uniref:Uncharacterized protein n=1 Tax=Plasmodiophora brassicae TaxID=37360 RepID=A0A0G4IKX7_PLABS|nr:hypothetical protein PBRA_009705 [Plasmodiophora brassicae]